MKSAIVSGAAVALSLLAAPAAHATVFASLGDNGSAFTSIDALGTRVGGTIYTADKPFADIPKGGVYQGQFLAAGPTSGSPATITFDKALNYLSFLWGSPDTYNLLTLTTNLGNTLNYTAQGLNFAVTDGNQQFSQPVQFQTTGGEYITSAKFSSGTDAFEVANFRAAVPEPATWALMIMGIGFAGVAMRRRQRQFVRYTFA